MENGEPGFCEALQCFHRVEGSNPSGKCTKSKSKPFSNKYYFSYDQNKPRIDFPTLLVSFSDYFWIIFWIVSSIVLRHSEMQKVQMALAFPPRLFRTHHGRGGNHLRFSPLVQAILGILFCMKHYMNILSGSIPYTKPHHTRQTSKQANNQTTERTNERTNKQTNKAEHTICGTFWLYVCKNNDYGRCPGS